MQMHAGAKSKLLYGFACIRAIIHVLSSRTHARVTSTHALVTSTWNKMLFYPGHIWHQLLTDRAAGHLYNINDYLLAVG